MNETAPKNNSSSDSNDNDIDKESNKRKLNPTSQIFIGKNF